MTLTWGHPPALTWPFSPKIVFCGKSYPVQVPLHRVGLRKSYPCQPMTSKGAIHVRKFQDEIAVVSGERDTLLGMERSMLNLLGQLSGIATEAKRWSALAPGQIACTRKTTWGLLDKWAVHLGGGLTHRLHLYDAKMLKENDLASMYEEHDDHSSRIVAFLQEISNENCGAFLEVEVREEKEAIMAAAAWAQRDHHAEERRTDSLRATATSSIFCRSR